MAEKNAKMENMKAGGDEGEDEEEDKKVAEYSNVICFRFLHA